MFWRSLLFFCLVLVHTQRLWTFAHSQGTAAARAGESLQCKATVDTHLEGKLRVVLLEHLRLHQKHRQCTTAAVPPTMDDGSCGSIDDVGSACARGRVQHACVYGEVRLCVR